MQIMMADVFLFDASDTMQSSFLEKNVWFWLCRSN